MLRERLPQGLEQLRRKTKKTQIKSNKMSLTSSNIPASSLMRGACKERRREREKKKKKKTQTNNQLTWL